MVAKVNSVAAEFRKVSDLQMAETTKRTIRENVAINTQLNKMSDRTMDLIRENEQMKVREKELTQEIEILKAHVKELTKANISNQRVMGLLKDRAIEHQELATEFHQRAMQCNMLDLKAREAGEQAMASSKEAEVRALGKYNVCVYNNIMCMSVSVINLYIHAQYHMYILFLRQYSSKCSGQWERHTTQILFLWSTYKGCQYSQHTMFFNIIIYIASCIHAKLYSSITPPQ